MDDRAPGGDDVPALKRERDLLRGAFEAAFNAIVLTDPEGRVTDCNPAAWRGLGLASKSELVGHLASELVFDRLGFEEQLRAVRADGLSRRVECVLQAGAGPQRTVDMSIALRRDEQDAAVGLVAVANDISERKRRDEALRLLNRLAIEFAAAPANEQLFELVAERVRAALDARALAISSYDPIARELTVRHVAIAGGVLSAVQRVLGLSFAGKRLGVDLAMEQRMITEVVSESTDLTDLSFGAITAGAISTLGKLVGIGDVRGLSLNRGRELLGSALLVMPPCPFPPSREMLHVMANLMAVTLRRLRDTRRP